MEESAGPAGPETAFQGLPLHPRRSAGARGGPGREAEAGGGEAGFHPVPKRPNQSSRGPPCGDSQEQPRNGELPPAGPESTCNPLRAQTRRRSTATSSLRPLLQTYRVLGDEKVLGPSRADLVEKRFPRAPERLSFPKTPALPRVTPQLHRRLLSHAMCQDLVVILPNSCSTEQWPPRSPAKRVTRIPSGGRHRDTSAWQTRTRNRTLGETRARSQHRPQRGHRGER